MARHEGDVRGDGVFGEVEVVLALVFVGVGERSAFVRQREEHGLGDRLARIGRPGAGGDGLAVEAGHFATTRSEPAGRFRALVGNASR
jgi:hypothetical protein